MQDRAFWKAVTRDRSDLFERLVLLLADNNIRYCIVGGLAVSVYADPLVSLDLDIVVTAYQLGRFESLLAHTFRVSRKPRRIEITHPESSLRVHVLTETRYAEFVERAVPRALLGLTLPVAALEDVLRGKLWALEDPVRSPVQRQKDLLDIARLVEAHPALRSQVPAALQQRLLAFGN